jgi:hypothetical protein
MICLFFYRPGKALLTKSSSAPRTRRKRNFAKNHARPWAYKEYAEMDMGERVQVISRHVTSGPAIFADDRPVRGQTGSTINGKRAVGRKKEGRILGLSRAVGCAPVGA